MERTTFSADLQQLEGDLARLAALVTERVRAAVRALVDLDSAAARQLAAGDGAVNDRQAAVDHLALRLLALQQPAARDLRLITTAIKVATDLERIGDQAVNLAETAARLAESAGDLELDDLETMAEIAIGMTREAVDAFLRRDVALARSVLVRDDEVDCRRDQVFRGQVAKMSADRRYIEQAMGLILVSRNLERVADHATNIAEDAVFLVEAKDVRHHHAAPS